MWGEENVPDLTLEEQETIFLYNQKNKTCDVSTSDRALIRKLDAIVNDNSEAVKVTSREGYAEYTIPKKWIKVRPPRKMSDEQKALASERMKAIHAANQN